MVAGWLALVVRFEVEEGGVAVVAAVAAVAAVIAAALAAA